MIPEDGERYDISVLICSHQRPDGLRKALESLVRQQTQDAFHYEIVVVHTDTPGTEEVVREIQLVTHVPVRSIKEVRRGAVLARNRGIDETRGEWIALFDDDQTADPQWLKALWDVAHRYDAKNVGGSLRLRFPDDSQPSLSPMCRRLLGETVPWNEERSYTAQEGPGSGNQMIHRSVFETIGRWDPDFTLRGYDSDLYSRMRTAGIRSWFTPLASGNHHIPKSRLSKEFFRELALHNGWQFAKRDFRAHGVFGVMLHAFARVVQSLFWHLPWMLFGVVTSNETLTTDRKVKIWRSEGYLRSFLHRVAPWISQRGFLTKYDFRTPPPVQVPTFAADRGSV